MSHENPTSDVFFACEPGRVGPSPEAYRMVTARQAGVAEAWYRDSIAANPELVVAPCRRAGMTDESWFLWGTEVSVNSMTGESIGSVDVLLVSESGRVGIVETKLSYNPERRRGVVAQALEYAVNLTGTEIAEIPVPLPAQDGLPLVDPEIVQHRLREGDFLLVVAGDVLDPRAVRLGQAMLGRHVLQNWELAMIDVALYQGEQGWLLIPTLRGTLVAETRQVFRITLEGLPEGVRPTVEAVEPTAARAGRVRWTRDSFTQALESSALPDSFLDLGRELLKVPGRFPGATVSFGTSRDGTLVVKRNGFGLLEYFLSGGLRFRPYAAERALEAETASVYIARLRELLGPAAATGDYPWVTAAALSGRTDGILSLLHDVL